MIMQSKQRPIRHRWFRFTLAALCVVMAINHLHQADADVKAAPSAASRITGMYAGDGVKLTVAWVNDQPRGEIVRNEQNFEYTGQANGNGIKGNFKNGRVFVEFTAKLEGDVLTLVSGSSTYKLKKRVDAQRIAGTYQQGANSMVVGSAGGQVNGYVVLGGKRHPIKATMEGSDLVGHYTQDDKQHAFSATLIGDTLTFATGIERIKMQRIADAWEGVQSKRKIYEVVLARSASAVESTVMVSPDNGKVAFVARRPGRLANQVWVNGKSMQSDLDPVRARFSPDGNRLAYLMKKSDAFFVVVDDKPSEAYDEVMLQQNVFSADSKRFIYAARTGKFWRIVVDGKAGPPFDRINKQFGFSPDGRRHMYVGERNRQWHVVADGDVSPAYEAVLLGRQVFSKDGNHLCYSVARNGKQVLIVDGKERGIYDAVAEMRFSPSGDRFAFVVVEGSVRRVITDGVAGNAYDTIGSLEFSPDGTTLAYPARANGKWLMVANDKPMGAPYDMISSPLFSPDSKHVIFLARTEREQFVVQDGKPSPAYDELRVAKFSPDSQRVGYVARKDRLWFVNVDGKASYPSDVEPRHLTFSPDSKHVVFTARRASSTYLVANGTDGKPIGSLLRGSAIIFDDANRFHTVVRRADAFIRLDVEILK